MDWSPFNDKRCDSKLCQYGNACNLIVLLLTLILITGFAQADMRLDRMIVDFQPNDPHHKDIQVFNQQKNNLYVNVKVLEVMKPGTQQEKRVPLKDLKNIPLVATPQQLIVNGNGQKTVRLLALEEAGKTDRIFRVNFSPALGKLKSKGSAIKLLVAYDALVIVRPEKPVANVVAERKGNKMIFRNNGNTNVFLQNGSQCSPKDKKKCESLENHRLYAGNVWELKLPFDGPISYELNDGVKVTPQNFGESVKKIASK